MSDFFKHTLTSKQAQGLMVSLHLAPEPGEILQTTWLGFAAYRCASGWWLAVEDTNPQTSFQARDLGVIASDRNPTEMRIFKTLDAAAQWAERTSQAVAVRWPHFRVIA